MTIQKYSTSIIPTYDYPLDSKFKTVVTEFDDGKEQRNRQWRFPKRTVGLNYVWITQTQRNTLHDFFRDRYGANQEFWFIDFQSRDWDDEYVGYGGPLTVSEYYYKGAAYTDQTEEAEDATNNDVLLVPATNSTAGDCNYFGENNRFDRVVINITTVGSHGCTGTWEFYSATGGWAAATITTDQTNGFTVATTGTKNVDITPSTNWQDYEVNGTNRYWLRWRITSSSSMNVQPKANWVRTYSKSFDVPCLMASSTSLVVYENGTSTTFTLSSGCGNGGVDVVNLSDYPSSGALITADFSGNLRLKTRMEDIFREEIPYKDKYNVAINLTEIK